MVSSKPTFTFITDLNIFEAVAQPRLLDKPDDSIISPKLFDEIKENSFMC